MGDLFTFACSGHTRASATAAFDAVADADAWARWGKPVIVRARFVRTAAADPRGIGAVRAIGAGPFPIREEITAFEPGRLLGYALRSAAPVRDYRGEVVFTPGADGADGTDIVWRCRFEELVPATGPLVRKGFQQAIGFLLRGLVRHLDRAAAIAPDRGHS